MIKSKTLFSIFFPTPFCALLAAKPSALLNVAIATPRQSSGFSLNISSKWLWKKDAEQGLRKGVRVNCYSYKMGTFAKAHAVLDQKVRQCPEMYLKLWFKKGKHLGFPEWYAECNGKTYILHRDCEYVTKLGAVYVRIVRDVTPRCAVLVTRLYLDTGEAAYRWYWKEWHIVREGERVFRRECVRHYVEEQTVLGI